MRQRLRNDNRGVATIVATIVSVVVLMLSLSLLLAAYSLFSSTSRKVMQDECKELAQTLALEIDKELTLEFDSYEAQKQSLENGENSIWFYLRYNIWNNDNWPYYCENESEHKKENAYRYFNLDINRKDGSDYNDVSANISLCIYWKSDNPTYLGGIKDELPLCIEITVEMGEQYHSLTATYLLNTDSYDDQTSNVLVDVPSPVNPSNNPIDVGEKWKWVLETRE